jgi:hypothetical protein
LDRAQADRSQPEHGDAVARTHAALVDRVVRGAHHVPGEQCHVVGDVVGHLAQGHVRHGDERPLGLGALQVAHRGSVAKQSGSIALLVGASHAEEAGPAGRVKATQHPIAGRDPGHIGAGLEHLADEFVPDREARLDLHATVVDVQIGSADPARADRDHRLVSGPQVRLGALLDADLAHVLICNGSHSASS